MSSRYRRFLLSACLPAVAIGLYTLSPVYAGFEWTPPPEAKEPAPVYPTETLQPIVPNSIVSDPLGDVSNSDNADPAIKIKVLDAPIEEKHAMEGMETVEEKPPVDTQKQEETDSFAINPYPLENDQNNANETSETTIILTSDPEKERVVETNISNENILWNEIKTFDVIEGFGSDMPLALALRQIVPAEYAFSFGKNVNPGALVSWTGGKPWDNILEESLTPLNITFELKGKKVILHSVPEKSVRAKEIIILTESIKDFSEDVGHEQRAQIPKVLEIIDPLDEKKKT